MYKMTHLIKLIIIYLTILKIPVSRSQNLDSPCPNVFQYRYNQQYGLYGEISIRTNPTNYLQMIVQMSVGNRVTNIGKIELARSQEAANTISNRQPLLYYLYFPNWVGTPPKVTQIVVNGNVICRGPNISLHSVQTLTTVTLQHTLSLNLQYVPSSNNISPDDNYLNFKEVPPRQDFPPPYDDPPDERFGHNHRSQSTPQARFDFDNFGRPKETQQNKYNFNPTLPPNANNFNTPPKRGQGATNVYRGNPFFNANNNPVIFNDENTPRPNRQTTSRPIFTNPPPDPSINSPKLVPNGSLQPTQSIDEVCGQSVISNPLIFKGSDVHRGAFPWLVAIFLGERSGLKYICSGSLISNRHVVTAAHCVQQTHKKFLPNEIVLILGKLNIQKWTPVDGEKIVEPSSIHIHPDYIPSTPDADIAILVLSESLEFTQFIRPICLWKGDTNLNYVVEHVGTVTGWGMNQNGVLTTQEPKQTNLPIVSQEKCLASNPSFHYFTSNRTFCAGSRDGSGPCNGDSGSGLIIKLNGKWTLRGIVSTAINSETTTYKCDLSNYVIFCDASKFTNWLLTFLQ